VGKSLQYLLFYLSSLLSTHVTSRLALNTGGRWPVNTTPWLQNCMTYMERKVMRPCVGEWSYLDRLRLPNGDDLAARHIDIEFFVWSAGPGPHVPTGSAF
jgi:hypothetical protein